MLDKFRDDQPSKPSAGTTTADQERKRKEKMAFDEKKQSEKVRQKFGDRK